MSFTPASLFDMIFVVILVMIVTSYARRGFMAALVQFVGNLVSLFGALFLSRQVAPVVFDRYLSGNFVEHIDSSIAQNGWVDLPAMVDEYAGFLPSGIQEHLVQTADSVLDFTVPNMAELLVEQVIKPLITPIIVVVLFFVAFALCRLLVSFVVAVLTNLNQIPVVGHVNRFLGLVMGVLVGGVDLYIVLCAVWALMIITDNNLWFLNESVLATSAVYNVFSGINPFV